tara:strand:- start:178 stop:447 length:270 start_codon:yes stop_codon:yes gene_type:complete
MVSIDVALLTICSASVFINIYLILRQHLDSVQNDKVIIKLIEEKIVFKKTLEDEKDTNNELLNETERLNALLSRLRDYYENRLNRRSER